MKKRIISIFLSLIICSTVVLQPKIVKADSMTNILGGGVLFLLLTTALTHAGYQIEDGDSANYIYNFFFKKYGISEEELEDIAEKNGANMLSWEDFQEKLTTPIDSNYPSLKDVFYKKVTSAGVKVGVKCGTALKQAIDQLVQDLPDTTIEDLGTLTPVTLQSLPFTLDTCYFPTVSSEKGHTFATSDYIKIKVSPKDVEKTTEVNLIFNTAFNNEHYATSLGIKRAIILPVGVTEFTIYNTNEDGHVWDNIVASYFNISSQSFYKRSICNIVRPSNPNYDRKYSFTIDSTYNCNITSFEICDSLWEIPFNEGSKALYNDNEAIWETLGQIETTLDGITDLPLTDSYPHSVGLEFPLDKEYTDTWEQDRTDVDIKTKDEVKTEEEEFEDSEGIEIPMDGIYDNSSKLTDKFPFCIPFDIAKCINGFQRSSDPVVNFTIPFPYVDNFNVHIDLSDYETPLSILRFFELLGFIIGLLVITRNNIIKG